MLLIIIDFTGSRKPTYYMKFYYFTKSILQLSGIRNFAHTGWVADYNNIGLYRQGVKWITSTNQEQDYLSGIINLSKHHNQMNVLFPHEAPKITRCLLRRRCSCDILLFRTDSLVKINIRVRHNRDSSAVQTRSASTYPKVIQFSLFFVKVTSCSHLIKLNEK